MSTWALNKDDRFTKTRWCSEILGLALTGNLFLILIFISSFFDCEAKLVFHAIKCHSYMFVHEWLAPSSLTFALIISPLLEIVSITTDPGQYHFQLLFEECCKQKDEKGGGVETLAHQNIMLQKNTEPENARSTNCFITD